jgi:DNA-binding transcriptional regulator YiaG
MTALRELGRAARLTQKECAALINVPVNTFRMWDSGLRPVPPHALVRATVAVTENERNRELLSLDQLARELGVHQRTLRAAARTGRLSVTFSSRSAFGRPIRLATRADGKHSCGRITAGMEDRAPRSRRCRQSLTTTMNVSNGSDAGCD